MAKAAKENKTMAEVSAGYEAFIKGKSVKATGKKAFDKVIKKASTPKPNGLK